MTRILLIVFTFVFSGAHLLGQTPTSRLPIVRPENVGMRSSHLNWIDGVVQEGIENGKMPGCVVAIGRRGKIAFLRAYGHRQLQPTKDPMTTDTVFDLASITKPVATATSIMILLERGKLRLGDSLSTYIPEFGANGKRDITILQLLTHQGGLIPDNPLEDYLDGREKAFERIFALDAHVAPGTKFVYTDVGFILLAELVERLSGKNVHEFSREHLFQPLSMHETGYLPGEELKARCATTERRGGRWMKGEVHDPRAYELDGIAGHAGLFSTAEDLAVYAQMMLNAGHFQGRRVLSPTTVKIMTKAYLVSSGTRGLGWDKQTGYSSNRGDNLSARAFGHGGFTGTVLWIDPAHDLFYIVLSNRVHPDGKGFINHLAGKIGTIAIASIDPVLIDEHGTHQHSSQVETGLDVLVAEDFQTLKGQRIGLITNHTGIDRQGRTNLHLMHKSKNVDLVALFSPEHGIAGELDVAKIADSKDETTGLKIYSLYGKSRKPSGAQLANLDSIIFDIQDIGTRFYTYISTMGLAMQAAASANKRFYVLDRPNPIGGADVSGAMVDDDKKSFVAFHGIPVRHGMTTGELARMFSEELELDLDLQIIPMRGWKRAQWFDQTGLWWVNPSPNMRSLNQAILYPGIGLLETTNLSVGRGTDTPFEIVGAPWIKGIELANALNAVRLPGVTFLARRFTPNSSVFANEACQGVHILITDRDLVEPNRVGLKFALVLRELYPTEWELDRYMRLLGNDATFDALQEGENIESILAAQSRQLTSFMRRRARYLIYE